MINRSITSDEEHAQALREIEGLMSAEADTADGDRLEQLATLVERYEAMRWSLSVSPGDGHPIYRL